MTGTVAEVAAEFGGVGWSCAVSSNAKRRLIVFLQYAADAEVPELTRLARWSPSKFNVELRY